MSFSASARFFLSIPLLAALAGPAAAKTFKEIFPAASIENPKAKAFVEQLDYQQGEVKLGDIGVKMTVGPKFFFLGRDDARKVITEVWGNPPAAAERTLGMLMPSDKTPVDDTWGAIITFDADGYVSDEEANKIDYDSLIEEMREGQAEENKLRMKDNYEPITIVRWAATPRYDAPTHKLLWAKELQFGEDPAHTLNYDMRVLGRHGVLSLNFVAGVEQLQEIETASAAVLSIPNFDEGYRYEDFDPKTDKKADFGIMGLIAGGAAGGLLLAKKGGLFAIALVVLKKAGVFIVAGLAAAGAGIKKFFGGKKGNGPGV